MLHPIQSISAVLRRLSIDTYTILLLLMVLLASLFPAHGVASVALGQLTTFAIGLLFFLHGAKLSREALVSGLTHWRLHLLVLASTFVMFPLLGLALKPVALAVLTPELYLGILFLCTLPSTVQSSIAFTAMARGNLAAAVCSASASNFVGIFLTPLLVSLLVVRGAAGGSPIDAIVSIVVQLLLPFLSGQLLRPRIGAWVDRHKPMLRWIDQGSILLVVYTAFSASVIEGLWQKLPAPALASLAVVCCVMLAIALLLGTFISRKLGFSRQDQIVIIFCGSKKSLASGVPMAKVLFPHGALGMIILPLMLFHQIQLMVCAILAQRYASQAEQ
ncbi:bile acid:sodium symporter family protein [Pseudoduganella danionis]|uniref:Bile acid:sodium symporter n=2 Tax=Telluria group TaxID=2895353 RepID=A0A845I270_9BURK|nr:MULTISPECIES: bile acid:sodium symporter family protein [Telluria group]MTW35374.1 bile acid:sodium symporter [Pseudoduganella danionis]MYN47664.1 bile acid:sodium symporter [Duganella fentianensis]